MLLSDPGPYLYSSFSGAPSFQGNRLFRVRLTHPDSAWRSLFGSSQLLHPPLHTLLRASPPTCLLSLVICGETWHRSNYSPRRLREPGSVRRLYSHKTHHPHKSRRRRKSTSSGPRRWPRPLFLQLPLPPPRWIQKRTSIAHNQVTTSWIRIVMSASKQVFLETTPTTGDDS